MRIEYGIRSDRGKVRTSNEDACIASAESGMFLVADGMGGHAAGEVASQIAASTIEEIISGANRELNPEVLLRRAVEQANRRVYEAQMLKREYRGMGSTLTVLTLRKNRYYIAQVGDSRAYVLRNGILDQQTQDHSLVWPLYKSGALRKEDISRHPQKNFITRSIGTYPQVEADFKKGDAQEGDIFLLCSDGLTDVLSDQDILEVLSDNSKNPQQSSDRLIDAANRAGGPDNITAVVVSLIPDKSF